MLKKKVFTRLVALLICFTTLLPFAGCKKDDLKGPKPSPDNLAIEVYGGGYGTDWLYSVAGEYTNKFGIDPHAFETRAEYDLAISAEYEKERKARDDSRVANPTNTNLYEFCKVSINYPDKPYYYYLTGGLSLKIGYQVIVPFGKDNTPTKAVVMSVGECYGSAFPCHVQFIKTVMNIV